MCRWDSADLCPNSMLNSPLLKPPHEYACALSLKLPQFCCWGDTALGKYSPSLLQVTTNLSLSHTHTHTHTEYVKFTLLESIAQLFPENLSQIIANSGAVLFEFLAFFK